MLKDEATLRHARRISTTLADMAAPAPCPAAADRFDWSSEALDELARAVIVVGEVVEAVTGGPDDDISRLTSALATTIVRRRNELLRDAAPSRSPRRP